MHTIKSSKSFAEKEFGWVDAYHLLASHKKTIFCSAVLGCIISAIYLVYAPNRYEATAQIQMAQISANIGGPKGGSENLSPLGVNVEDPSLLMARLGSPTAFNEHVSSTCQLDGGKNSSIITFLPLKNISNVIQLKVNAISTQVAGDCVAAIFTLIKDSQALIVEPFVIEAKSKLDDDQRRLEAARLIVSNADKSSHIMSASYLSTRDEIGYLLDDINSLRNFITSSKNRATRLIAPIYINQTPIGPKRSLILIFGFCVGGIRLFVFICQGCFFIPKSKV